jgi:hypothetical protein
MNWINWHAPSITPAEGLTAFGIVFFLNLSLLFLLKPRNPPSRVKPDPEDDGVHGDGAWTVGRERL